jgi:polysaccharide export outer membrane protein
MRTKRVLTILVGGALAGVVGALAGFVSAAGAQTAARSEAPAPPAAATPTTLPKDFVIGPEDVLSVTVWREKDLSADVTVRPDGKITLPLVNEIQAAGLTPAQLRDQLTTAVSRFVADPSVTVAVKQINSLKVYISGQVGKPGAYPLTSPTTVLQLIVTAGGLHEFADTKNIVIIRRQNGQETTHRFNYKDVLKGRNLAQNIQLVPGDTILVP